VPVDRVRSAPTTPAIVFERNGDLYAVAMDRSRVVRLTRTHRYEDDPAVSADGSTIAFTRGECYLSGGISTLTLEGRRQRVLTHGYDCEPAWGPDGTTIYFVRNRQTAFGDCGSIFRVSLATGEVRRVTNSAPTGHSHLDPAVSPDGAAIAYSDWDACSGGDSSPRLRVVDPNGHRTQDLAKLRHNGFYPNPEHDCPTWSPDGKQLAFRRNADVFVANRDGSEERRVTRSGHSLVYDPLRWSPNGQWIAYMTGGSPRSPADPLLLVHPDGTRPHRIAPNISSLGGWLPSLPK